MIPPYRRFGIGFTRIDGECNGAPRYAIHTTQGIRPFGDGAHLQPVPTQPVGARSEVVDYLVGAGLVVLGFVVALVAR